MGHTLVATFGPRFNTFLHGTLDPVGASKVPYGRQCDRGAANRALDYHMTVVHWAGRDDSLYLPKIPMILFPRFSVTVTESAVSEGQENSWILYFAVKPGERYCEAMTAVCSAMRMDGWTYPHITLAVSKDLAQIREIRRLVDSRFRYPFVIDADALDLYHIWQPVRKVCRIYAADGGTES